MQFAPTRYNNAVMTDNFDQDDVADTSRLKGLESRLNVLELLHGRDDMAEYIGSIEYMIVHLQGLRAEELKSLPARQEAPCRTKNLTTFPAPQALYGSRSRLTA